MKVEELKPGVFWVGAIDWAIRDFHGYITPRGSTYNNYLIMDDGITLIDTVKHDFFDISLENIRNITDPSKIKHMIVNHIEPDHCSGLAELMKLAPNAVIYCTEKGKKGMDRYFDISKWVVKVVKTGETLNIGKRTLMFIETPMLHWPDSMMTYCVEDKILFSQDAFGQHIASSQRFDDEFITCSSYAELDDAVWDYYANILMPFGGLIKSKIAELKKLGIPIDIIAPDHGIIWRKDPARIVETYDNIAGGMADERVVIIYDTMWHSTERMSRPMALGIREAGLDCKVIKLKATPLSMAVKEFWRARGCLIGSPTLNNTQLPSVGEFIAYLKGLRPKNRIFGAFGSFGWAGGAVKNIYEEFKKLGLEAVEPGVEVNIKPSPEDEQMCYEFGKSFAEKVKEYHKKFL